MKISAILVSVLLLASLCAGQAPASSAETAETPSDTQSVAAAARASRQPKIDPAKEADLRRLLEVVNAGGVAMQTRDEMEKSIKPLVSNALPAGEYREKLVGLFFEKFRSKRDPQQLIDLIIPIYDKYYSDQEIKELIQIYGTPLGHKLIAVTPKIMAESQEAGGKWGRELGRQCMLEVLAEHPEFLKSIEDAKKIAPER